MSKEKLTEFKFYPNIHDLAIGYMRNQIFFNGEIASIHIDLTSLKENPSTHNNEEYCENCLFFYTWEDKSTCCRRFPRVVSRIKDWWCGEWKPSALTQQNIDELLKQGVKEKELLSNQTSTENIDSGKRF